MENQIQMMPGVAEVIRTMPESDTIILQHLLNNVRPVIERAWIKRPANARVTIIEVPIHEKSGICYWWIRICYTDHPMTGPVMWIHKLEELTIYQFNERCSQDIFFPMYPWATLGVDREN